MEERILILDDDQYVCDVVRIALESEGYRVESAPDGDLGLEMLYSGRFDLLLLDIMLPGKDGWEICRQIRAGHLKAMPVIMLTARSEEVDRVLGLELGADDYVTKPFSPRELAARVKALIRRSEDYNAADDHKKYGNLVLDIRGRAASVEGRDLDLAPKEIDLLALMARQAGRTFTREELLKSVWGYDLFTENTRTVDEHIKRLRNKIARYDENNTYIQTVWGTGYKFEVKGHD
jgi:DNA-binding response OmpR family regulator